MNPVTPQVGQSSATGTILLVLAGDGRVLIASAAASAVWQAKATELVGDFFPNLFTFDVVSQESGWVQSQWEVLVAAAGDRPIALKLQPKEAAELEVQVRLEKTAGEPAQYLAFITLPTAAAPTPVTTAVPLPADNNFLTQLNERSPLGFFDLNFLRNEVYYSPTWKRQLGYPETALPNSYETWLNLIHPDDSAAAPDRQGHAGSPGSRSFSHEFRMKHADGHYVWLHSVGIQHYAPNGSLQRVMGANLDISDRKEFEEYSLRAEERIEALGDRGRAGLFDLDFARGLYWLSPGFKSLLGYTDAELPNALESVLRSLPMDETAGGLPAFFLARQPGQVSYFEILRLRHREERDVLVQTCIVRQISRHKELQRVFGFVLPGDAPDAAESDTGISSAHLAGLLAELQEGVLLADADGKVMYLNAKAEHLLGLTLGGALGQEAGEIFRLVHLQSGQPGENPVARVLSSVEAMSLNAEFALDTGAATPSPVVFSARPVLENSGRPAGAVVVFRQPGEMSLTPEELVRSNRFEALGQLAGGIAHDFNNLLTTILGGVSLAKDNRDYSGLENSERACMAAKALSKQLLSFSKGGTAVRQVVKTADILTDSVRLAAAGSAVKIEVRVAPDTGTVCVDRAQMLQVFQNLVINSIQAMTTGQGLITLTANNATLAAGEVAALPAGLYVAIEVRDNGAGIPAENLQRIFDPFFTTKKTGTGLGLATVLSIVKRHGGQMGVDSEVGTGTAFTVFLPAADRPEEVEARRAPSFNYAQRTGRVLFMDDDTAICTLASGMLENLGYKYDIARNGEEAIQFYKRYLNIGRPYDAVIMDLTIIGGMGGEAAFKFLRELHPEVRAIVASGYDNEDMARQFLELGFCGYLTKPYRVGDLGRILKKVLGS